MLSFKQSDINRLFSALETAEKIVITTHFKPDGDAMGSSLAMYGFIRQFFCSDVKLVLNDRYPQSIAFMVSPEAEKDILTYDDNQEEALMAIKEADHIVALDFNAFISSASELLYHILKTSPQCQGKPEMLPFEAAESLMTGMTTDTNNFANSTYPSTLQMASELIGIGVDRDQIILNIYNRYGENRMRLLGHILKDLLTITEDGVAYVVIDKDTLTKYHIEEGDTEGFVNMPLTIDGVRMSILVKEDTDRVRVSIRSKKGTSANRCSRLHFNGGGHENAAGGRLNIPGDINSIKEAPEYIERHTHIFMTEENEA